MPAIEHEQQFIQMQRVFHHLCVGNVKKKLEISCAPRLWLYPDIFAIMLVNRGNLKAQLKTEL